MSIEKENENNEIELEEVELTATDLEQTTGGTTGGTIPPQQKDLRGGVGGAGGASATNTAILGSAFRARPEDYIKIKL